MKTITSANSVFMLMVAGLFPVPQHLQGYSADDAFSAEAITPSEVLMGVDGRMSAGYTPFLSVMNITLQADSPSISIFDYWLQAMQTAKEVFVAQGTIQLPGPGKSYALSNGILTSSKQISDAKKTLQPVQYAITWENIGMSLL